MAKKKKDILQFLANTDYDQLNRMYSSRKGKRAIQAFADIYLAEPIAPPAKPPMEVAREYASEFTRWTFILRCSKNMRIIERRGNGVVQYRRGRKWVSPSIYATRYDIAYAKKAISLLRREQIKRTGA